MRWPRDVLLVFDRCMLRSELDDSVNADQMKGNISLTTPEVGEKVVLRSHRIVSRSSPLWGLCPLLCPIYKDISREDGLFTRHVHSVPSPRTSPFTFLVPEVPFRCPSKSPTSQSFSRFVTRQPDSSSSGRSHGDFPLFLLAQ